MEAKGAGSRVLRNGIILGGVGFRVSGNLRAGCKNWGVRGGLSSLHRKRLRCLRD